VTERGREGDGAQSSDERTTIVVGLGEVGRPLLEVLSRAHRIEGIDLPPRELSEPVSIMHVCYPAEVGDFVAVTEGYVRRYQPRLVIIHSTVPVGTTARVQARVRIPVAHSPVRGKHVRMADELMRYVKYVGTGDDTVAAQAAEHFRAAGMRTRRLPSPEATELAKLAETTYFGVLIAFAQDVDRMAREVGVSYDDVASFFDEVPYLPQVRFFPGIIGGHCVLPNIELLKQRFHSELLKAVEWSNELRVAEGADHPLAVKR
jgi:UDP-N-acetyl-D-mannosaminuronate dehydrogenase